jgi:hypothetical protein
LGLARWSHIDLAIGEWTVPEYLTKNNKPLPLSIELDAITVEIAWNKLRDHRAAIIAMATESGKH